MNESATVPAVWETALTPTDLRGQVNLIQDVMKEVMKNGEHYGVIPGTQKPTLLKPGAEKLCLTFRLDPQYHSSEQYDGQHLTVKSTCTLYHINSERRLGSGEGSCSTKETKYAYRHASRMCPVCEKEAIIKGKAEYGGGWLCFKKKNGCGAKFRDGDQRIEGQATGLVPTENLADQYNTVLKMANKRSLVAAVLNVTAASDIFTQDLEDAGNGEDKVAEPPPATEPAAPIPQSKGDANLFEGYCARMRAAKDPLVIREEQRLGATDQRLSADQQIAVNDLAVELLARRK